jgi:pimeloyl-ACP methyl ester carboxylesterase
MTSKVVYFTHGKTGGLTSLKIQALSKIALALGYQVVSPNYLDLASPEARGERLLSLIPSKPEQLVLVGSSMGGYVVTVASATLKPRGLFLTAPAFYKSGYANQNPVPVADLTVIVPGWHDTVVEPENSLRFAQHYNVDLHLVNDDHRLEKQIPLIEKIFENFLERLM